MKLIYATKFLLGSIGIYILLHIPSVIQTKLPFCQIRKSKQKPRCNSENKTKTNKDFQHESKKNQRKKNKNICLFSLIHKLPGVSPLSVFLHTVSSLLPWFKEILQQIHIPAKKKDSFIFLNQNHPVHFPHSHVRGKTTFKVCM